MQPNLSNRNEKSEAELRWFRRFQDLCEHCPKETPLQPPSKEGWPDIYLPEAHVGIELTRYFSDSGGSDSEAAEKYRIHNNLAEMARRSFERKSNARILVDIEFKANAAIRKSEMDMFSTRIAGAVLSGLEANRGDMFALAWCDLRQAGLHKIVEHIDVAVRHSFARGLWQSSSWGFIGTERGPLQAALDRKQDKIDRYRKRCGTVWLLVVAQGDTVAASFDSESQAFNDLFTSSFDRVFVYDVFENWSRELRIQASPPA